MKFLLTFTLAALASSAVLAAPSYRIERLPEPPNEMFESRYVDVDFGDVQTLRSGDLNDADVSVGQVIRPNGILQGGALALRTDLQGQEAFMNMAAARSVGRLGGTPAHCSRSRSAR